MTDERRSVVIAHPGRQHVYQTVRAADEAGVLQAFATGLYLREGSRLARASARLSAAYPRSRPLKRIATHASSALDGGRVVTFPRYVVGAKIVRRLIAADPLISWSERRCDIQIARWLDSLPGADIVHGFEGGALATFEVARRKGCTIILDAPNAHERVQQAATIEGCAAAPAAVTRRIRRERELATSIVAPSSFVAECLIEAGVERERIATIPYGVDVEQFRPADDADDGPFRVLFAGFASHRKGLRYLLEAWRDLDLADAELLVVGDADRTGRALLSTHRSANVRWLGYVPSSDIPALFRRCHVFALPSLAEGSALVTYEALASGLPVVTTPCSGSVVRHGVDGFVVPPRDAPALAESIARLYADCDLRRRMSATARAHVVAHYTWAHYRARLADLYRSQLAARQ